MSDKKNAFLELLSKHQKIIFKVGHMYFDSPEDQKDLAQEIIMQLWKSFEKYDPKFKVTTWMYRIALNVAISFRRKYTARKKYESDYAAHFVTIDQRPTEEDTENIRLLRKFIVQLDEMNRALIILYLDGNSHQEIAEVLDISVSNVGTRVGRIKKKLLKEFQKVSS